MHAKQLGRVYIEKINFVEHHTLHQSLVICSHVIKDQRKTYRPTSCKHLEPSTHLCHSNVQTVFVIISVWNCIISWISTRPHLRPELSFECRDCQRSQLERGAGVKDHIPRSKISKDRKIGIIFEHILQYISSRKGQLQYIKHIIEQKLATSTCMIFSIGPIKRTWMNFDELPSLL